MRHVAVVALTFVFCWYARGAEPCTPGKEANRHAPGEVGALCEKLKKHKDGANDCTVVSPDQSRSVCVKDDKATNGNTLLTHVYVERGEQLIAIATYNDLGPSWKPVWSPDSKQFALTYTTGGAGCCWHVDVFDVQTGKRHSIDRSAQQDMAVRNGCKLSNVYFSYWKDATSAVIWLSGREPIESTCSRGAEQAYRVDARTGRVLERYSPEQTKQIRAAE